MSRIAIDRLTEFFGKYDTRGCNTFDFIHRFASPLMALLLAELFWPTFVVIRDMVFLDTTFEDEDDIRRLHDAEKKYSGDRQKIEESFNVVEVLPLFGSHMDDITDEENLLLAQTLATMWHARLQEQFPERRFAVKVLQPEETGDEVAVLFRQI